MRKFEVIVFCGGHNPLFLKKHSDRNTPFINVARRAVRDIYLSTLESAYSVSLTDTDTGNSYEFFFKVYPRKNAQFGISLKEVFREI